MDKYIGQTLGGRYEVREIIGTGGMAVVYKAYCTILHRYVAIKVLKEEFASDEEFRKRFYNEAQAVAKLSHNNIVSIYDVSQGSEAEYIVMELCEGITLKEYLRQKQRLTWQETLFFAQQVAKALDHAHSRGIIHQDIKPQNVMLLRDGTCKVMDFGIASFANSQETRKVTSEAIGSVHYISPEQAKGIKVDYRTDLYSLGVVMYEMLTGTMPFRGDSAVAVVMQHLNTVPPRPSEVVPGIPSAMDEIVMHAMCANAEQRYSSAMDLFNDMERLRSNPNLVLNYSGSYIDPDLGATRAIRYDEQETQYIPPVREEQETTYVPPVQPREPVYRQQPDYTQDYTGNPYTGNPGYGYPNGGYPPKSSGGMAKKVLIGVVAVLAVVAGAYALAPMFNRNNTDTPATQVEQVTVPKFVGQNYINDVQGNDAYSAFQFTLKSQEDNGEQYSNGEIITQNPTEGTSVASGTTITLTIAHVVDEQAKPVTVPSLAGQSYSSAASALEDVGLMAQKQETYSDTVSEGLVISSNPSAGSSANPGSVVVVTVSKGKEPPATTMVRVPNLSDLTQSAAQSLLEQMGLKLGTVSEEESTETVGSVIAQTIPSGTEVSSGTSVGITIAKAAEQPDTPNGSGEVPDNNSGSGEVPDDGNGDQPVGDPSVNVTDSLITVTLPDKNPHAVVISIDGGSPIYNQSNKSGVATCRVRYSGTKHVLVTVDGKACYDEDYNFPE